MSIIDKLKSLFMKKAKEEININEIRDKYNYLLKNAIGIKYCNQYTQGLSYFGGTPKVPNDFKWPYYEPKTQISIKSKYPLSFLAQFDCEELALYDPDNLLPHEGILCFFYALESERWGFDPDDEGSSRVYWFSNKNDLVDIKYPLDLLEEYRYPKLSLTLSQINSYPSYENLPNDVNADEYAKIEEYLLSDDESISKLLGFSDVIQSRMEDECELISKGYYLGGSYSNIPEEEQKLVEEQAQDKWQLLLQLDTVNTDNFELAYGDYGRLFFWIRKEDLKNKDFSKVWLIMQCY